MSSTIRAYAEWLFATASSSPLLSRLAGRLSELPLPQALLTPVLRAYVHLYRVNLSEAVRPAGGYATFNEFFTRRLVAGSRPVADGAGTVVAPCDAVLSAFGEVPPDGRLEPIKGRGYSIEALLGDSGDAAPFCGGLHATLYLSPAMYHRVHSPLDAAVRAWRYLPGRLFPVNAAGMRSIPGLLTRNERVCILLDTDAHGPAAVVLVGAANVGRISLAFTDLVTNRGARSGAYRPVEPIRLRRGDELGVFNLGSTVVLLLADRALAPAALTGDFVRMGQPLWRRRSK